MSQLRLLATVLLRKRPIVMAASSLLPCRRAQSHRAPAGLAKIRKSFSKRPSTPGIAANAVFTPSQSEAALGRELLDGQAISTGSAQSAYPFPPSRTCRHRRPDRRRNTGQIESLSGSKGASFGLRDHLADGRSLTPEAKTGQNLGPRARQALSMA